MAKFRMGFVTNSSSSSYIITCGEILDKEALLIYLREEYGIKGEGIINHIVSGKDVKQECEHIFDNLYVNSSDLEKIDDEKEYLFAYEDIEYRAGCSAALAYDVYHKSVKHLFSDSWSGFDG